MNQKHGNVARQRMVVGAVLAGVAIAFAVAIAIDLNYSRSVDLRSAVLTNAEVPAGFIRESIRYSTESAATRGGQVNCMMPARTSPDHGWTHALVEKFKSGTKVTRLCEWQFSSKGDAQGQFSRMFAAVTQFQGTGAPLGSPHIGDESFEYGFIRRPRAIPSALIFRRRSVVVELDVPTLNPADFQRLGGLVDSRLS